MFPVKLYTCSTEITCLQASLEINIPLVLAVFFVIYGYVRVLVNGKKYLSITSTFPICFFIRRFLLTKKEIIKNTISYHKNINLMTYNIYSEAVQLNSSIIYVIKI